MSIGPQLAHKWCSHVQAFNLYPFGRRPLNNAAAGAHIFLGFFLVLFGNIGRLNDRCKFLVGWLGRKGYSLKHSGVMP